MPAHRPYKSIYTKVFEKHQYDIRVARRAYIWFQGEVRKISQDSKVDALKLIRGQANLNRRAAGIIPGEMYLFQYDAKWKDTLPYWDRFPLIFPFKRTDKGFYGINLHYLHYRLRIILLDRLMDFRTNSRMNEHTKLRFAWETVKGLARYELVKPCVKQYLTNHVKTPLKKIESKNWVTALMLPVEDFQKATKEKVWRETGKGLMGTRA